MDRGDDRRVDEPAVREREKIEPVVDHVELVGPLEGMGDVEALDDLGFDVGILGIPVIDH